MRAGALLDQDKKVTLNTFIYCEKREIFSVKTAAPVTKMGRHFIL
ncbi:hypothetical protein [Heyndrickxia coagulans]|nr:hypothetical protein [Heyndrickxia coagulans]